MGIANNINDSEKNLSGYSLYTGIARVKVLAINPNKEWIEISADVQDLSDYARKSMSNTFIAKNIFIITAERLAPADCSHHQKLNIFLRTAYGP